MADSWLNVPPTAQMGPAEDAAAVTCSDTVDLTYSSRGLYVTTAGVYRLLLVKDASTVDIYLSAGICHPLRVRRVYSTGSISTSGVVAVY